jgi:hypothetical protein
MFSRTLISNMCSSVSFRPVWVGVELWPGVAGEYRCFKSGRRFLKGHEDPGFPEIQSPPHEKLHGKKCFAAACGAADQGWSAFGKASLRDFIETFDARRTFFEYTSSMFCFYHSNLHGPLQMNMTQHIDVSLV